MRIVKSISLLLFFSCFLGVANAQTAGKKDTLYFGGITVVADAPNVAKKDTLYYLLDLKKIPVNDRMITIDYEIVFKLYTINCRCSESNKQPVFFAKRGSEIITTRNEFSNVKFISLPALIGLTKAYKHNEFNKKYMLYFIEPVLKKFLKNRVMLSVPYSDSIDN